MSGLPRNRLVKMEIFVFWVSLFLVYMLHSEDSSGKKGLSVSIYVVLCLHFCFTLHWKWTALKMNSENSTQVTSDFQLVFKNPFTWEIPHGVEFNTGWDWWAFINIRKSCTSIQPTGTFHLTEIWHFPADLYHWSTQEPRETLDNWNMLYNEEGYKYKQDIKNLKKFRRIDITTIKLKFIFNNKER